jgi:hypothetical protein
VVHHLHPRDIFLHHRDLELVLLLVRYEAVDEVLEPTLVAMELRRDSLPGGTSHSVTVRHSEGWPLVSVEDPGPKEDLCDGLEFHPPWKRDFLDPISRGGGGAQVHQQSLKPAGGDRSFSPDGLHLINISVDLLDLCVARGRVLLIVLVLNVYVMVLQLLLLSLCALGYWAPRYHQLDHKRLLLLRYMLWCIVRWLLWLWHIPRCKLTNGRMIGALACGAVSMSHLSFRNRRV